MILNLTNKEKEVILWALLHNRASLERELKTIPEKDIYDLYEEEIEITNNLINKFTNEKSN